MTSPAINDSPALMRDLRWSPAEKAIARKVFQSALRQELEAVIRETTEMAAKIEQAATRSSPKSSAISSARAASAKKTCAACATTNSTTSKPTPSSESWTGRLPRLCRVFGDRAGGFDIPDQVGQLTRDIWLITNRVPVRPFLSEIFQSTLNQTSFSNILSATRTERVTCVIVAD